MPWWNPRTWAPMQPIPSADLNKYLRDDLLFLYPPIKVQGGQTTYPYYMTGAVETVALDGSGNFDITISPAFDHAFVFGHVQAASGGSPFAVSIGGVDVGSIACHASSLEGTDVTSVSLAVIWWALGY